MSVHIVVIHIVTAVIGLWDKDEDSPIYMLRPERIHHYLMLSKQHLLEKCNEKEKKMLEGFIRFLKLRESKEQTIMRHLYTLAKLPKLDMTREQLEDFIIEINESDRSAWSKTTIKRTAKLFFRHIWGDNKVSWIKVRTRIETMNADTVLDEYEMQQAYDACTTVRDQAIIALLGDTGIRRGELLTMRISNVAWDFTSIVVTGKTGTRRIPLTFSQEPLKRYVLSHPRFQGNDSLLWTTETGIMHQEGLRKLLARVGKRAKLGKTLSPRTVRHSRATIDARYMTETVQRYKYGWKKDSPMPSVYAHIGAEDLDKVVKSYITNSNKATHELIYLKNELKELKDKVEIIGARKIARHRNQSQMSAFV